MARSAKPQAPSSETRSDTQSALEALLARRARAAQKRLKRIEELEAAAAAGKEMNADQVSVVGCWVGGVEEAPERGGGRAVCLWRAMVARQLSLSPTHPAPSSCPSSKPSRPSPPS